MKAATYVAPHWYTQEPKVRCSACDKVVFPSRAAATTAAAKISVRTPMFPYLGTCGHWHLTRKRPAKIRRPGKEEQ